MNHFESGRSSAYFAEATQSLTALQSRLLLTREMKEPQHDASSAVAKAAQQRSTSAVGHVTQLDFAFDQHLFAGAKTT